MPKILSPLSLAVIAASLPQTLLSEEVDNDGYPAPPGVYGQAEILKNTHLNLGTGSPYVIIKDQVKGNQPAQEAQPAPKTSGNATDYPLLPAQTEQNSPPAFRPTPVQKSADAYPLPATQNTYQPPENIRLPANNNLPRTNSYPDASEVMQQYQNAKQLPFDQWGSLPKQNSNDYGDTSVPIDTSPRPMAQQRIYQAPYENTAQPYSYSSPVNRSSQFNYSPNSMNMPYQNNWQSQYFNPGHIMGQFFGDRGYNDLPPPASNHLKTFEQFPVPHMTPPTDFYGMPGAGQSYPLPGSNVQFMHRIPEEDIIYPPSYPGRR